MMLQQASTLTLLTVLFTAGSQAETGIKREEIDKQRQELHKDRWRFISNSSAFQLRAEQEIQREKNAVIATMG
jgi:hypothetical protein